MSAHHCLPLWHIAKNMVMDIAKNDQIAQLQVWYMSYPGSNQDRVFKYQVKKQELNI